MPEQSDRVVVNENEAFIPKQLFGQDSLILAELKEAGVMSAPPSPTRSPVRRVEPPDLAREMRWLKEHRHEYVGRWVALDGDRLIGSGASAQEVREAARQRGEPVPFLHYISPAEDLPFGGW
jgi:hypothetical protein